ncbi:CRISPR-associated endonuclease Cas2 [Pelistega sp. MC2]|uniref:CRISPR-associated endonuclease Cas2 n=1 Tax=Pelistega sp. MC2 TaxID=1720297 RepID=UPI0008D9ACCC|nr:CRISPR-associated endonuclease Cas2 [Pelistega sp. MC2]
MKREIYIFAYDIADTKRRRQARNLLVGYSIGGQKSLFECLLRDSELKDLCHDLRTLLCDEDTVHYIRVHTDKTTHLLGVAKPMQQDRFCLI